MGYPVKSILALFLCGWLVPLAFAVSALYRAIEIGFLMTGGPAAVALHSFPYLDFSKDLAIVSGAWLAAVVIFLAWRVAGRLAVAPLNKG